MAEALARAERNRAPIPLLTDAHADLTVEDAYAIQSLNIERRLAEGRLVRGRKVGLTSAPMQQLLGVDEPDFGVLLDDMFVEDGDEKLSALNAFSEQVIKGRWNDIRQPTESELKATLVLRLPLNEVSSKIRIGPPIDDEEDYDLPIWAGVVPLSLSAGVPIADERLIKAIEAPRYATHYIRPNRKK